MRVEKAGVKFERKNRRSKRWMRLQAKSVTTTPAYCSIHEYNEFNNNDNVRLEKVV